MFFTLNLNLIERLVPALDKIDCKSTSVEQLELEKKIMEKKINEIFESRTYDLRFI